uniref:Growth factor receptor bound protein 7 n=1 Tax=Aquila chrysaetos chrysaetos TaxID=223781 RepID=A0A663E2Y0_AQUCH
MDGGAQQSSLREPPGPGNAEQEGVPGERDGGEGPPEVKRSQPLFIHGSRWVVGGGGRTPRLSHGVLVGGVSSGSRGDTGVGMGARDLVLGGPRELSPSLPAAGSCRRRSRAPRRCPASPTPSPSSAAPPTRPSSAARPWGRDPPREGVSHVSQGAGGWGGGGGGARTAGAAGSLPAGCPDARPGTCRQVVKVFGEDGACRSLEASAGTTARQLCETLVRRTRALQDHSWALVEQHQHLALERCLEDHESVVEVQSSWPPGADSRFVFRKNFAKYELFKSNAQSLFPEVMVSSCLEANKTPISPQNFLNSGSCPEVQGFLQLREAGRKVWKRFYFSLRRSGLYYSTKGTSKDPRHLQYFADLTESNIYYVTQGKKHYGTPTEFGFCIKPYKVRSGVKGLKLLCSEDEQSRSCWMAAFRLFKVSPGPAGVLPAPCQAPRSPPAPPQRSVSDNALVAMDFSGCTGRVIENPSEVLTVALEEAQAWRVSWGAGRPAAGSHPAEPAIHRTQPWFHGRISREDTQQLIGRQGLVDGVFLVRESQRNPKGFVLSLCHLQRVKHYLILPVSEEGRLYFTMDDGQTRFADLIQLVEFHQINRGILPCKLRHYCTCVAL